MSEMIERVARAIRQRSDWDTIGETAQMMYRAEARAAIEAMREPTEGMWNAPANADAWVNGVNPTGEETEAIWRAMIDEALR